MCQINTLLPNIRRIIKLYDNMLKPVCDRYGLVPIEATIISFLFNNPGRDTAADIVELRMLSKSNVSQAVESLIQKSLLQRRQDKEDRRRIHLLLTPESKPITQEIECARGGFRKQISGCKVIALAPFRVRTRAKGKACTGGGRDGD